MARGQQSHWQGKGQAQDQEKGRSPNEASIRHRARVETNKEEVRRKSWWKKYGVVAESFPQEVVWQIPASLEDCRFELDKRQRYGVVCVACRKKYGIEHGLILFPPHEWNLKDGKVYHLENGRWRRWKGYRLTKQKK